MVKITFKSPSVQQPFTLDIDPDTVGTVGNLKNKVGDHTGDQAINIKLIHKGKILKDEQTISSLGLSD